MYTVPLQCYLTGFETICEKSFKDSGLLFSTFYLKYYIWQLFQFPPSQLLFAVREYLVRLVNVNPTPGSP